MSIDRIAILADRGDLAFVEFDCATCGSRTMSLVLRDGADPDMRVLDTAAEPELDLLRDARARQRPPIDDDDVRAVRRLLATWDGDLRTLVDGSGDGPTEPAA